MRNRIAILADFPLDSLNGRVEGRGGGQTCTWLPQLAKAFENTEEFEIHWVILNRKARKSETIEEMGQFFHSVRSVKFSLDLFFNYFPARRTLKKALRRIQPDLVHAWGTEHIYSCALQDFNGPKVLSMQGILTEYQRIGGLPNTWMWRKMVRSEPSFIRDATLVTSESQWGIDRVREIAPEANCEMVEYGVHPSFYEIEWRPEPQVPYALYVGGGGTRKGLDVLMDALKLLPHRTWEMRLAGDSSLQKICDESGLKNIKCLGLLQWDEMKQQLQGAWCSVLPTRGDTSPNSVKEARVVGVPVVTTKHGGQAGYILDEQNGKVLEELNAKNLSQALDEVMTSFTTSKSMGQCRHADDRAYLRPERTAEGFTAIYRKLLKNSGH